MILGSLWELLGGVSCPVPLPLILREEPTGSIGVVVFTGATGPALDVDEE